MVSGEKRVNQQNDEMLEKKFYSIYYTINELEGTGNFLEAIKLNENLKSEISRTTGNKCSDYSFCLEKLAHLYQNICRYEKSEQLLLELNDLNKNNMEKNPLTYANGLQNLAIVYAELGRYEDAENLLREAEEIYLSQSNLKDLDLYSREVKENPGDEYKENLASYALILNNLGKVLQEKGENKDYIGDFDGARKCYDNTIKAYSWAKRFLRHTVGDSDIRYGRNLKDLANIHGIIGNYEYAEEKMKKACDIYKNHYSKEHPAHFEVLHKLAWLEYRQGKYRSAGTKLTTTKNRFKSMECHPAFAQLLNNLAKTSVAESYNYTRKSEKDQKISDELCGNAYNLMKKAFEINNQILPQLLYMDSDEHRLRFLRSLDFNMHLFLTLVMEKYSEITIPQARKDAFDFVLRRKSLTMEVSHFIQESMLHETDDKFVTWNDITSQISNLNFKYIDADNDYSNTLKELKNEKKKMESQIICNIPEKQLQKRIKEATGKKLSKILDPNSVLIEYVKFYPYNFKAKGEENSWKSAHYLAFLMYSGKPDDIKMMDLGKAEDIDTQIVNFRESLNNYRNSLVKNRQVAEKVELSFLEVSKKLREMIFDPFEIKKGHQLIVSPDDLISTIPLEVLPLDSDYLMHHYQISYLGSGRDLTRIYENNNSNSQPVIIANPDYNMEDKYKFKDNGKKGRNDSENILLLNEDPKIPIFEIGPFKSLKNSEIEGERVAKILKENGIKVHILTKKQATESNVKKLDSPLILHISTHGFFVGDNDGDQSPSTDFNPLVKSGLVLAGANSYLLFNERPDYPEDGVLTAFDVNSLKLFGTEMVVLSACETGMGKLERGEGVFGLRRSFILAGSKTLIMSLWKVNDLATMIMMDKFYQNLLSEGMGRLSSLRNAQKYLKNITIEKIKYLFPEYYAIISEHFKEISEDYKPYSHPYFWGGFILQGETSALNKKME